MLQALQGCLVLLSETGDLRFCYLGTEPAIFMAPERPKTKDYNDTKNQLVRLKRDLQNMSFEGGDYNNIILAHMRIHSKLYCCTYLCIKTV